MKSLSIIFLTLLAISAYSQKLSQKFINISSNIYYDGSKYNLSDFNNNLAENGKITTQKSFDSMDLDDLYVSARSFSIQFGGRLNYTQSEKNYLERFVEAGVMLYRMNGFEAYEYVPKNQVNMHFCLETRHYAYIGAAIIQHFSYPHKKISYYNGFKIILTQSFYNRSSYFVYYNVLSAEEASSIGERKALIETSEKTSQTAKAKPASSIDLIFVPFGFRFNIYKGLNLNADLKAGVGALHIWTRDIDLKLILSPGIGLGYAW
jgi:hypothetical protein